MLASSRDQQVEGLAILQQRGVPETFTRQLPLVGISGISNLIGAIKAARYFELDRRDVVLFPLTDSMALYRSRAAQLRAEHGALTREGAAAIFARYLSGIDTANLRELGYWDKKALHNLKYFTWVEQQGKTSQALANLWDPDFWTQALGQADAWDALIREFNERTGVLRCSADPLGEKKAPSLPIGRFGCEPARSRA